MFQSRVVFHMRKLAIILGCIFISTITNVPCNAQATSAFVNKQKVISTSTLIKKAAAEIAKNEAAIAKLVADCNNIYDTKKASGSNAAELESIQTQLQKTINDSVAQLNQKAKKKESELEGILENAMQSGCRAVGVNRQNLRMSQTENDSARSDEADITSSVLLFVDSATLSAEIAKPIVVPPVPNVAPMRPQ